MRTFVANPQDDFLKRIANYILGRAFGMEAPGPLRAGMVPSVEHRQRHLAVMTELKFKAEMRELGLGSGEISDLWQLLVSGIREEQARAPGTRAAFANDSFAEFSARPTIRPLLNPGDKLALWSGGIVISEYAQRLGYCCLETTRLGEMFDRLKLYQHEQALWRLWDYLAQAFVEQAQRIGEIHIFVRNFDRKSTLFTVEYPRLQEMISSRRAHSQILWHVIVGDGDSPEQLRALTEHGKLEVETPERQYYFDHPGRAEILLRAYLVGPGKGLTNARQIMGTNRYPGPL